jgi:DNA-binding response OmpR family regulator
MRILLAEDERTLARVIVKLLESSNYSADTVCNGEDTLTFLNTGSYDAVILDISISKPDSLTVLKKIRAQGCMVPVLLLTAKSSVEDRVAGLDSGANYYVTKPFDGRELLAVIRAITRGQDCVSSKLTAGSITLDRATFELTSPTGSFRLANKEFQMLELLMLNPNNVISPNRFLEKIWGYDSETEINVVWVYISYLRKKLSALHANIRIKATRNVGYSLEVR